MLTNLLEKNARLAGGPQRFVHVDNMRAFLAETTITINELLQLQPGDIVTTKKPADDDLIVQVENRNKFAGKLYRHKDNRAIRIVRLAEMDETL